MTPTTVLIGLDGATFSILNPLMARGVMPHLQSFIQGGVHATLRSIIPPLTPPAWTSLMTGKRPGEHGVFDFFQKESPKSLYLTFASSQDVRSATIWSLASEQGKGVISLNFPLMFPPPAINGSIVPGGWMPWRQLRLGCYPPGLFDRLKMLPSFNARELALDMKLEEKALEGCDQDEFADWIKLHIRREQRWFEIVQFLMKEEPADLVAVMFDGVDKLQHLCWPFLDPDLRPADPSPWEQEIIDLCEMYFQQLDEIVGQIIEAAGNDATIVIASDHGFGASHDVFFVNTWLEQQGYLKWSEQGDAPMETSPRLGMSQISRHIHQLDWDHTVAYCATPSSNGINIVNPSDERDVDHLRAELTNALLELRHPSTGEPFVTSVWTREEAFAGPYQELGPDITFELAQGAVSILRGDETIKRRTEVIGTHRPEGIFIASGPGIQAGRSVPELSITDVAPLLLCSLGLPAPDDVSGRIPVEIFNEDRRKAAIDIAGRRQPASVPQFVPDQTGFDQEAETTMLKRLRALGYIE